MNFKITKKRNVSTLPVSSNYNNWLNETEVNPSFVSYKSIKMIQAELFQTVQVNPEIIKNDSREETRMRKTFSSFKNSQSRVTSMKEKVFDLSQEVILLKEKTKKMSLQLRLTSSELEHDLKEREQEMTKSIHGLNRVIKTIIKGDMKRTEEIENDTLVLKESYLQIKEQLLNVHQKVSAMEKECGFMTFVNKLKY